MIEENRNTEVLEIISDLPKYLRTDKMDVYQLVMVKNDWDITCDNSYVVMYAKHNLNTFSKDNVLVFAKGRRFSEAILNMKNQLYLLSEEGKVKGKNWIGKVEKVKMRKYNLDIKK
jgi:hypothetical protein